MSGGESLGVFCSTTPVLHRELHERAYFYLALRSETAKNVAQGEVFF